MPQSNEITDRVGYLARMTGPKPDKLRPTIYFPANPRSILDLGCADGAVTIEYAKMFPNALVRGIDLDRDFIELARRNAEEQEIRNVVFENAFIRDVVDRNDKYDVTSSSSTNHEIAHYDPDKRRALVVALSRMGSLLRDDRSVMAIRDMILHQSMQTATFMMPDVIEKIRQKNEVAPQLKDFEELFGTLRTQEQVNHFLLKYMYTQNWDRELKEHYLPYTVEEYNQLLPLMDMQIVHQEYYLLPFLKNKWSQDFGLTEPEVSVFGSTGMIIASKKPTGSGIIGK
jgi:2-polyprenyl-3-methyl-5-hydroxy-6-metoxy-1,4-benzoquinol methylase